MASQTNEQKDENQGATESGEKLKPEMKSARLERTSNTGTGIGGAHRPNFGPSAVVCKDSRLFGAAFEAAVEEMGKWRWGISASQGGTGPPASAGDR